TALVNDGVVVISGGTVSVEVPIKNNATGFIDIFGKLECEILEQKTAGAKIKLEDLTNQFVPYSSLVVSSRFDLYGGTVEGFSAVVKVGDGQNVGILDWRETAKIEGDVNGPLELTISSKSRAVTTATLSPTLVTRDPQLANAGMFNYG